jgi:hypothetical protein
MIVNLEAIPEIWDGTQVDEGKRRLSSYLSQTLSVGPAPKIVNGQPMPHDPKGMMDRMILINKIKDAEKEVSNEMDFNTDEVKLVESCISSTWNPQVAMAVFQALHGHVSSEDSDDGDDDIEDESEEEQPEKDE